MKQSKIGAATQQLIHQTALSVNSDGDAGLLNSLTETWDHLQNLKNEMAAGVLEFVGQVEEITNSQVIMQNLGQHETEFKKLLQVFYTDIDGFTRKMQEVRLQHEHRSGPIVSMNDLTLYNNLSMEYGLLNEQLMSLIGPTITNMIVIVHEAAPMSQAPNNNVTDVVAKNV